MNNYKFKLLAGLGNPGSSYRKTRHNVGFMTLERLATKYSTEFKTNKKIFAQVADIGSGVTKQKLLMPNTFMNESGKSIRSAMEWFNCKSNQILIIVDDIDLPLGKLRVRTQGSSGGHNGLKSIIHHIGTQDFCRLKIGIGHPCTINEDRKRTTVSHVLGKFNSSEEQIIDEVIEEVLKGIELIKNHGLQIGINQLNSFKPT